MGRDSHETNEIFFCQGFGVLKPIIQIAVLGSQYNRLVNQICDMKSAALRFVLNVIEQIVFLDDCYCNIYT